MTSHKSGKIRRHSINFKLEVIKFAEENSIDAAERKFNINRHSVRDWKKKKANLQKLRKSVTAGEKRVRLEGGRRKLNDRELGEGILDWIIERRSKGLRVSRELIMSKSTAFDDWSSGIHSDVT